MSDRAYSGTSERKLHELMLSLGGVGMLSHNMICEKINIIALSYPLKRVAYFGSFATDTQTTASDLDILVEFDTPAVSLLMLSDLKNRLEDELMLPVDIIHYPLPEGSFIEIGKVVPVYGE